MDELGALLGFAGIGLLLGLKHALETDHVVAVSAFVSQTKSLKKATHVGVLWGVGHTLTLLVVGGIILVLKISVPEKLALGLELPVAIFLVALGVRLIVKARREKIHLHSHVHDEVEHTHLHSHVKTNQHHHTHQPLFMGLVHGMAGSAALVLLVLGASQSTLEGMAYIFVFGLGSIVGMIGVSLIIGLPFLVSAKFEKLDYFLKLSAGSVSCLIGVLVMHEILVVEKLLF